MQEEKIGIREILDRYGEQYITKHKIAGREKGLIRLLSSCGTPALGSHFSCCDKCGHIEKANNSCRDRHCHGGTAWKKQDTAWDEIKTLMLTIKQPNCPECKKGRMRFSGMAKHPYLEPG